MVPSIKTIPIDLSPVTHSSEEICRVLLPWAENLLGKAFGPKAKEYAGLGLVTAVRQFDAARGVPFNKYTARMVVWTARQELRRVHGRSQSSHRHVTRNLVSLDRLSEEDAANARSLTQRSDPAHHLQKHESLVQSLRTVDQLQGPARWVVLGRFLGDFDNPTLGRMLDHEPRFLHRAVADLRRSWRLG